MHHPSLLRREYVNPFAIILGKLLLIVDPLIEGRQSFRFSGALHR